MMNPQISPLSVEDCTTDVDEDCDGTLNAADPIEQSALSCVDWFTDRDWDDFGDDLDVRCDCLTDDVYTVLGGGAMTNSRSSIQTKRNLLATVLTMTVMACQWLRPTEDFVLTDGQLVVEDVAQAYSGSILQQGLSCRMPNLRRCSSVVVRRTALVESTYLMQTLSTLR